MKRCFPLFLIAALLLCACSPTAAAPTTTAATETTVPPTTQPQWAPYAGSLRSYTYYYSEGRDREWEEDILYVAGTFVGELFGYEHPYLTDGKISTFNTRSGMPVEFRSHFDAEKKETFLRDINELIPLVSELEDQQILYALQKAVAKLGDLHSQIHIPTDWMYPLFLSVLYPQGAPELYVTLLPQRYEAHLGGKLVAVNDMPLDEVIAAMEPYISYENEHALMVDVSGYLLFNDFLTTCGITQHREQGTRFTVEAEDGTQTTLLLDAMSERRLSVQEFVGVTTYSSDFLTHARPDELYWWEYFPKEDILYIRMNHIEEDYRNYNYSTFSQELLDHVKSRPAGQTVVIDFRSNPGGYYDATLAIKLSSVIKHKNVEKGYVLIDGASFSGAIVTPASICLMTEKAELVGAPGGQPTNFYACSYTYNMPNSGHTFTMSDRWMLTDPEDNDPALMPDVVVYQTLEDMLNGRDTVWEYIKAQ